MWIAVVVFLAGSLLVAEVGRRAAAGTLPRNALVGIRVPSTMRDDEAWAVAHRAAGPPLVATGLAGAVVAVAAGFVAATSGDGTAAVVILVGSALLVGGVLWAGRRAAGAVRDGDGRP